MPDGFERDPAWFFQGDRHGEAVAALKTYFQDYVGSWFDRLADSSHPDDITARDIVAVTTLNVDIPATTSIWLLGDGAAQVTALLSLIPPRQAIWDLAADMSRDGAAWRLWDLIRGSSWPRAAGGTGMGPTKISKLMAAKRPDLIPLHDRYIRAAVFGGKKPRNYWEPWTKLHRSPDGAMLRHLAAGVREAADVGDQLSILRVIDIVLWHWAEQHRNTERLPG